MSLPRALTLGLLAASLAGNAFFAQALGRRRVTTEPATEQQGAPPIAEARSPRAVTPTGHPQASGAGAVTLQQAHCAAQLAGLQESMAGKSEALRGVLPPALLFERGQRNPEAEGLLASVVTQIVARAGGEKSALECRDVACKLVFTAPAAIDDEAWDQALTGNAELQGWSQQLTLGPSTPAGDSKIQRSLFFKLNGPRAVAALAPGRR